MSTQSNLKNSRKTGALVAGAAVTILLTLICIMPATALAASSFEAGETKQAKATGVCAKLSYGVNFVDEDGDGYCDNYQQGTRGTQSAQGIRGAQGTQGLGACYIDEDGDGYCDNYPHNSNCWYLNNESLESGLNTGSNTNGLGSSNGNLGSGTAQHHGNGQHHGGYGGTCPRQSN